MTATPCYVHFESWAGRTRHAGEFLGETKAGRCKVRLTERALRHPAGKILYPPRWAVTFPESDGGRP